jgi:outer membrane protein assembly factor BamD (BamD/ComL family)
MANVLYFIGERYYLAGQRKGKIENFNESTAMMEYYLSVAKPQGSSRADAYYVMGLNYQSIEDDAKAAESFDKAYQAGAKHQYADYCLFAQGKCYEKLQEKDAVSAEDAKAAIAAKYSKLVSDFPQSGYAKDAKTWLENNSK